MWQIFCQSWKTKQKKLDKIQMVVKARFLTTNTAEYSVFKMALKNPRISEKTNSWVPESFELNQSSHSAFKEGS